MSSPRRRAPGPRRALLHGRDAAGLPKPRSGLLPRTGVSVRPTCSADNPPVSVQPPRVGPAENLPSSQGRGTTAGEALLRGLAAPSLRPAHQGG
jgi:hypothetical protein